MKIKRYCFFGSLLQTQEKWLNRMAEKGYRLVKVGKVLYEWEECQSSHYEYRVEFIAFRTQKEAQDYVAFLEELGYQVFFKNINLNYSIGKVKYRPWAEKGARIATHATTFDRELLIIEKERDGKPFEIFTTWEDKINYYKNLRNPYVTLALFLLLLGMTAKTYLALIPAVIALFPVILYQYQIKKAKKEARIME